MRKVGMTKEGMGERHAQPIYDIDGDLLPYQDDKGNMYFPLTGKWAVIALNELLLRKTK